MSAASQEVFQNSCLEAAGQTDRGFPTNTHRTLAGPDWKPDTISFLAATISSIAQNTLLLYGTTKAKHKSLTDKPPSFILFSFFLCSGGNLYSKSKRVYCFNFQMLLYSCNRQISGFALLRELKKSKWDQQHSKLSLTLSEVHSLAKGPIAYTVCWSMMTER